MGPAKQKTLKMSLGDFLGDQSLGSWADEMDDMPAPYNRTGYGMERRSHSSKPSGFGCDRGFDDRGDRFSGYNRNSLPLPDKPPYTAHLGNLSFDAIESDVMEFFSECDVANVRIVSNKIDRKPKGFGYVEFSTLEGLKKALTFDGLSFGGRNIRISVADARKYINLHQLSPQLENVLISRELVSVAKDRADPSQFQDWVRKGPLPDISGPRRASDRGGPHNETSSEFGSGDNHSRRPYGNDNNMNAASSKIRDFPSWERKGPLSPMSSSVPANVTGPGSGAGSGMSDNGGGRFRGSSGVRERRPSPNWGERRSGPDSDAAAGGSWLNKGKINGRLGIGEKTSGLTAADTDISWRSKMRPDKEITGDSSIKSPSATPDASTPTSPTVQTRVPVRPKLNLTKRSIPEGTSGGVSDSVTAGVDTSNEKTGTSKSNPFGGAKPIDTYSREREIVSKRLEELSLKKEQEDKAKEQEKERLLAQSASESITTSDSTTGTTTATGVGKTTVSSVPVNKFGKGGDYDASKKSRTASGEGQGGGVEKRNSSSGFSVNNPSCNFDVLSRLDESSALDDGDDTQGAVDGMGTNSSVDISGNDYNGQVQGNDTENRVDNTNQETLDRSTAGTRVATSSTSHGGSNIETGRRNFPMGGGRTYWTGVGGGSGARGNNFAARHSASSWRRSNGGVRGKVGDVAAGNGLGNGNSGGRGEGNTGGNTNSSNQGANTDSNSGGGGSSGGSGVAVDKDGWSTVSSKSKGSRRSHTGRTVIS